MVLLQVAAALREGRAVEPESYDCVTIFFSDIVGFTNISGILQPQEVHSPALPLHGFMLNVQLYPFGCGATDLKCSVALACSWSSLFGLLCQSASYSIALQ